ncbi:MAG: SctK family type III secretion system sorting platform protein [Geminicoccaceae bacterium]
MTAEPQIQASSSPHQHSMPHRAWLRFERLPAAYCHPGRIETLLPDGLPEAFRDRLQGSTRLRPRLSAILAQRLDLAPCSLEDLATPEGRFAQLEGDDLKSALRRIGAIWHARKISKFIRSGALRQLIERLGRDNHRAALRLIDLAPADEETPPPADASDGPGDIDVLMGLIDRDALLAVNAWCRGQPAALAKRLRLKLPPCPEVDGEPPASHRNQGVLIVDRMVRTLASEADEGMDDHG